ncbi:MAG: DUF4157 domain-containing protein [Bacteroidota bacterium]|nr:DUF4157 domain-containing protein [Bacteroidota bacterium]
MYSKYDKKQINNAELPDATSVREGDCFQDNRHGSIVQQKHASALADQQNYRAAVRKKENTTGLPDQLKSGIENLSGLSMHDLKVHYNSSQPAQLNAHAYAQGTDIHIASGQERHLPHEAWHVVQQKQGRVKPTMQMKGKLNVNDDDGLEKEADAMGSKALQLHISSSPLSRPESAVLLNPVIQRKPWSWMSKVAGAVGMTAGAVAGGIKGAVLEGKRKFYDGAHDTNIGAATLWSARHGAQAGYDRPGSAVLGLAGMTAAAYAGPAAPLAASIGTIGAALAAGFVGAVVGHGVNNLVSPMAIPIAQPTVHPIVHAIAPVQPSKTEIMHKSGHITLDNLKNDKKKTNHEVGKEMVARLDPQDAVQGSATGVNWTWMQFLRKRHPKANIVRGHLLNHDLGGFGMPGNLYPISTKANQLHSQHVEQNVKNLLITEYKKRTVGLVGKMVNYSVEVNEATPHDPKGAIFVCSYSVEGLAPKVVQIPSDLGADAGGFGGLHDNPLAGTTWAHNNRRGFEEGKEAESLVRYKGGKKITEQGPTGVVIEPNVGAEYLRGASESLDLIFDNVSRAVFNIGSFKAYMKPNIAYKLNRTSNFKKAVLDTLRASASYEDNRGDVLSMEELMIQIVQEQLVILNGEFDDPDIGKAIGQLERYQANQIDAVRNRG